MSQKTYDPKLRSAIREIREVLKKHDCLALINLSSKTHGEFLLHLDSSWSVLKLEDVANGKAGIRVKAKGVKVGTQEHDNLEASVAFICNSADFCNHFGQAFYQLKALIGERSILEHNPLTDDRIFNDDRDKDGTHLLRHASLTEVYHQSKDIKTTAYLAGHGSIATTQRYAKARGDKARETQERMSKELLAVLDA